MRCFQLFYFLRQTDVVTTSERDGRVNLLYLILSRLVAEVIILFRGRNVRVAQCFISYLFQITLHFIKTDRLILKKLDDKSYTTGRVLITGSMIERDSVRMIEKADRQPAE